MRIFSLFLFTVIVACNSKETETVKPTRLFAFLDSFDKANSKYYDFESTEEQGDSLLKITFLKACSDKDLLKDFPLVFSDVGRALEGQPYAHFVGSIKDKPGWIVNFDIIVPIEYSQYNTFRKDEIYKISSIKTFTPVTQAWIYNVILTNGVLPYLIRENGKTKIVSLGANYTEATITKD